MEAVIKAGGYQYQVVKGQKILVNKLDAETGNNVEFDVLALVGDQTNIGTPLVAGAKVVAKVLEHMKGDKVTICKYKRRKGYHKKQGHRQQLTQLEITDIKTN